MNILDVYHFFIFMNSLKTNNLFKANQGFITFNDNNRENKLFHCGETLKRHFIPVMMLIYFSGMTEGAVLKSPDS